MRRIIDLLIVILLFTITVSCSDNQNKVDFSDGSYDCQNCWIYKTVARGSDGYYFIQPGYAEKNETGELIYYPDKIKVSEFSPVENNIKSVAVFDKKDILAEYIFYSGKNLYLVSYDDQSYYLEEFDSDIRNRRRICKICDNYGMLNSLIIHQGNIYFDGGDGFYCKSIYEDRNAICILKKNQVEKTDISYIFACNNKIYFSERTVETDVFSDNVYTNVYVYDVINRKTTKLLNVAQGNLFYFVVINNENMYYYIDNTGIVRKSLSDNEEEIIYKDTGTCMNIGTDGKNLILDDSKGIIFAENESDYSAYSHIRIIDTKGNLQYMFEMFSGDFFLYGDDYYFCPFVSDDVTTIHYLPRSQIYRDNPEWIDTGIILY